MYPDWCLVSITYQDLPPHVSSRAPSLFSKDRGAKSLFLMSGCGVKCYVPDRAGELSPPATLELDLTTLTPAIVHFFTDDVSGAHYKEVTLAFGAVC